ncbi:Oidioi.mRNA.OKI2018_I69.PAR.g12922.t1.cds [Oikopleura dioica]|uniref:Oidioi.mRNA.OKI2018_I69.PAR.g12922.t1.cds n=1 Tax=Oikopleura dioica TaxID=34765 RepID=A0ABN7S8I1_OIKDI|nr:Oidioi.mRNA.OKI2018_I69.PAR.g12922.t1.cds [Oikopleura dioica]
MMKGSVNLIFFVFTKAQNLSPENCGHSASCFSTTSECDLKDDGNSCVTSLWKSVTYEGKPAVNLTIYSSSMSEKEGNWAGLGFSEADDMAIADLFICKRIGNDTKLFQDWNHRGITKLHILLSSSKAYSYQNGRPVEYINYSGIFPETVETSLLDPKNSTVGFWCSFTMSSNHTKSSSTNSSTVFIYDKNSIYHLIEAYGQLTSWDLTFHDGTAAAGDEVHGFYVDEIHKEYKIPSETKNTKLFKSHGSLMIIAWGFFIPVGALLAAARVLFQKGGLWFHLHRAFMIIGVLLNIAGFTVIFIEKGGFVSPSYTLGYVHGIFGCMIMFYSGINVLLGLFRPDLESPRRKKWRRTHFIYAGLAILLSNTNITTGLYMVSLKSSAIAFGVLSGVAMLFIPLFHFWLSSDDLPMPIHHLVLSGVLAILLANTVAAATTFLLNT